MNIKLKGIDGEELPTNRGTVMTFREVAITSLLTPLEGDDDKKKFEKWETYKKLRDSKDEVDLTIDDLGLIKKSIGKFQPPLIMGQCWELLEAKESKSK